MLFVKTNIDPLAARTAGLYLLFGWDAAFLAGFANSFTTKTADSEKN